MCDEDTETDNASDLQTLRINRRGLGVGAGAATITWLSGCGATPAPAASAPQDATAGAPTGRMVTIDTPDGSADAFFVSPASGRHPAVIVWPDVAGLRDAFVTMATRLAKQGYAVLAVNPYYRSSKMPVLATFSEWATAEGKAKIGPMREALTAEGIAKDGAALVAWLDQQDQVDTTRKIGATGYCMGGPFAFRTAAVEPTRVGAIGSFHGGGLVTDGPESPHKLLAQMTAAALICVAQNDDARAPETKSTLKQAAERTGIAVEIEVYPAQHGWCVIDSPVYDQAQAERAWSRMLATFATHL